MKCKKKITITGYRVMFSDLREVRHLRTICEDIYPIDNEGLEALGRMGINVADFIEGRYARAGYHVISVERITPRRVVSLDLRQLWDGAGISVEAPPATEDGAEKEIA